jgi:hypothetical protein
MYQFGFSHQITFHTDEPTDQWTTTNRNRKNATVQRTVRPGPLVITFVTVCTEVVMTQERSHAGNHIVVVVVIVQVDLLIGCGSMVNDSRKKTPSGNSACTSYYKCKNCGQTVNKRVGDYTCGNVYCKTCKDYYLSALCTTHRLGLCSKAPHLGDLQWIHFSLSDWYSRQLNTFVNGCFPEKTKGSRLLHTISKTTIHCPC